jgi:hypothetical protein
MEFGTGMSSVRLGMTEAKARSILGPPAKVVTINNDFGALRQLRYPGAVTVGFQSGTTVTAVTTEGVGDRTSAGIGVGSTEAQVKAKVPNKVKCSTTAGFRACVVGKETIGQRVTAFSIRRGRVTRVIVGFVID